MTTQPLLPCPFCGGKGIPQKQLRQGYENYQDDPDAYAYFIVCHSCAGQGGWSKSESGAIRVWNVRNDTQDAGRALVDGFLDDVEGEP